MNPLKTLLRLAFFASRNGSAMRAVQRAITEEKIAAEIVLLASNNEKAAALQFAEQHDIPTHLIDLNDHTQLLSKIIEAKPDLIILSGYLRKIPADIIKAAPAPIINTHPALLPKYGGAGMFGLRVHRAVLQAREKITGATIHLVNEHYDQGQIIAQTRINVLERDTPESLAERVISAEAELMISTLSDIASSPSIAAYLRQNPS